MKKSILFVSLVFIFVNSQAQVQVNNKIKYYFNRPVDTTVATAVKAVYLKNCAADTLAAYLGRAKYSLDICLYDYEKTVSFNIPTPDTLFAPAVAEAINSAYARGVKVRYIYEASNANTGRTLLDTNIHTLGSPQGPDYTIMHNKFVVIDAGSPDPNDPIVWTGCMNWYTEQFNWDYNNIVILQDSALAYAYTAEFNMMWGDTGTTPNLANSKFGMYKTDLGLHNFTIGGNHVELYFSPSDGTDTHIQSTIATANTDMYLGMYDLTDGTDASDLLTKQSSGVYEAAIVDNTSSGSTGFNILRPGLGSNFKEYIETDTSIFHNKFVIVDPSDPCSDPTVLTGSHNWTISANTHNDENTLIIHNDTAANLYYQYFKASYNSLGGSLVPQPGCRYAGVPVTTLAGSLNIYPNPSQGEINIAFELPVNEHVSVDIYNLLGQKLITLVNDEAAPGKHLLNYTFGASGVYLVHISAGNEQINKQVVISKN